MLSASWGGGFLGIGVGEGMGPAWARITHPHLMVVAEISYDDFDQSQEKQWACKSAITALLHTIASHNWVQRNRIFQREILNCCGLQLSLGIKGRYEVFWVAQKGFMICYSVNKSEPESIKNVIFLIFKVFRQLAVWAEKWGCPTDNAEMNLEWEFLNKFNLIAKNWV